MQVVHIMAPTDAGPARPGPKRKEFSMGMRSHRVAGLLAIVAAVTGILIFVATGPSTAASRVGEPGWQGNPVAALVSDALSHRVAEAALLQNTDPCQILSSDPLPTR